MGLLNDSPQVRPVDTLIMAPPSLKSNSRRKFSRLALDLAVTSPFQNHLLVEATEQEFVSITKYADRKCQQHQLAERCAAANLGYEPIDFENMGGLETGDIEFLKGICALVDERQDRRQGEAYQDCMIRLNFDLQRGLHRTITTHHVTRSGHIERPNAAEIFLNLFVC